MKKGILVTLLLILSLGKVPAQKKPTVWIEREAILQVAQYYVEGYYEGKAEQMNQVLHPELAKRGLIPLPGNGKLVLDLISRQGMMDAARAGIGKLPKGRQKLQVKVLDISRNIASVKIISTRFVDYLQLGKLNGGWRIINILSEINSPISQSQ